MNQITHQQAQAYLHSAADESLRPDEKANLDTHHVTCNLCQAYAQQLGRLESALRTSLHRRWGNAPVRLQMDRILGRNITSPIRRVLNIASAPILVTLLILLAAALTRGQISGGSDTATPLATVMATNVPTPSVSQTRTNTVAVPSSSTIHAATTTNECEQVHYVVQPGDTLASIAEKFGVSMQEIREANSHRDIDVPTTFEIIIPVCNPTPGNTLTYTPPFTPTSYTP